MKHLNLWSLLGLFIFVHSLTAQRPVYIFAHRTNDLDDIQDAIDNGANAIEFDLQICVNNTVWKVNHDVCGGSVTVDNWLDAFNRARNNYKIAAIAFDIKASAGDVSEAMIKSLVSKARAKLPSNMLIIYGVGSWGKRAILEDIMDKLRANEAVTIDMSTGSSAQQKIDFFKNAGVNNQVYADGYAANFATPGSVWTNLNTARANRDSQKEVKMVYAWTFERENSIKSVLIDYKADGVLVNDCAIYCVDFIGDDGLTNALDVLEDYPRQIRKATRADLSRWGFKAPAPKPVVPPKPVAPAPPVNNLPAATVDVNYYYRLSNTFLGEGRSLDTYSNGNNDPFMGKTGNYTGQYWQLSSLSNGYYRLTNSFLGSGRSLDTYGGNDNRPFMGQTGNFSGQYWKLTELRPGVYRLTNSFLGDLRSLDTYSGNANQPFMGKSGNYSGQMWVLTRLSRIR